MNSKWELNSKLNVWFSVTTSYLAGSLSPCLRPLRHCGPRAPGECRCLPCTFFSQGSNYCQEKTIKASTYCCKAVVYGGSSSTLGTSQLVPQELDCVWEEFTQTSGSTPVMCMTHTHTHPQIHTGNWAFKPGASLPFRFYRTVCLTMYSYLHALSLGIRCTSRGRSQDGGGIERGDPFLPHKFIKSFI